MRERFQRKRLVAAAVVISACSFTAPFAVDSGPAVPDSGPCTAVGFACSGRQLLECTTIGELPTETTCPWGCTSTGTGPHCGTLVPSGGAVTMTDLFDPASTLQDKTIGSESLFGSDVSDLGSAGEISNVRGPNNSAGTYEERDGIGFQVRGNVGVFRFKNLTIDGTLQLRGGNAVALVASGDITITGLLDAHGDGGIGCGSGSNARVAGPGGGGAVQLVAGGTVRIMGTGNGINAGGCGGETRVDAGGTILIEAPFIVIDGAGLAVNGGGGAAAGSGGEDGQDAQLSPSRTPAGGSGSGASGGGAGGITGLAGGGGGAAGRIRLNTGDGTIMILNGGFVSPRLEDTSTSATAGTPMIE